MTATISNWGNSQGIRFPKSIMKDLKLVIGDKVKILVENHKIILEPIEQRKVFDINELVKEIPLDYVSHEEFDDKSGKEEW